MTRAWVVPLGGQLDLLVRWLEPMLQRPGLTPVPAGRLHVVVAPASSDEAPELEPFDALVGPVRIDEAGVVADVIPVGPFLELRRSLGADDAFAPTVVFARADGAHAYEPIEAVASEAVTVDRLTLLDVDA